MENSTAWETVDSSGTVSRLRIDGVTSFMLQDVHLSLNTGECIAVSGPSGGGKTCLLRVVADLDPCEGEMWLDGVSRDTFPPPSWRRLVGLLSPESAWWDDVVGAHFDNPDTALLKELGFPANVMDWTVSRLSSGERQRLALVRLLSNRPRVLLLDEPTANLDPANVARVEELISEYRQTTDAAVLWVSHDPHQLARVGSRHLRMVAGRLHEEDIE